MPRGIRHSRQMPPDVFARGCSCKRCASYARHSAERLADGCIAGESDTGESITVGSDADEGNTDECCIGEINEGESDAGDADTAERITAEIIAVWQQHWRM